MEPHTPISILGHLQSFGGSQTHAPSGQPAGPFQDLVAIFVCPYPESAAGFSVAAANPPARLAAVFWQAPIPHRCRRVRQGTGHADNRAKSKNKSVAPVRCPPRAKKTPTAKTIFGRCRRVLRGLAEIRGVALKACRGRRSPRPVRAVPWQQRTGWRSPRSPCHIERQTHLPG